VKIVGLLSWFDESPSWVAAAITGFARICDTIVAQDGAYALFPGARPCSHPDQAEAAVLAAEAAGVGLTLHRPNDVYWGNEVEKRNHGLRMAAAHLTPGEDWLIVFDADFHMLRCNPEMIRYDLENTDLHVATYVLLDGMDYMANEKLALLANRDDLSTEWTSRTRDIYRWNPTVTVGPAHWHYSAVIDGEPTWLRGPWAERETDAVNLDQNLAVYHRTKDRPQVRRDAAKGYYDARALHKVEPAVRHEPMERILPPCAELAPAVG